MNIKNNQEPKGLHELMGKTKKEPFEQFQREALFPREQLEPLYHEFVRLRGAGANPSAYEFFNFLLRQSKPSK